MQINLLSQDTSSTQDTILPHEDLPPSTPGITGRISDRILRPTQRTINSPKTPPVSTINDPQSTSSSIGVILSVDTLGIVVDGNLITCTLYKKSK